MKPGSSPSVPSRRTWLGIALAQVAGTVIVMSAQVAHAADRKPSVTLDQARSALASGSAIVFDIREPEEHARGVAAGVRLLPMSQLAQRLSEIPKDGKKPVYLMCNTQNRSSTTWKALQERGGYEHVQFVEGGMSEWTRRGWPVVTTVR